MSESLEALSAERRALVVHLPPTHPPTTHPPIGDTVEVISDSKFYSIPKSPKEGVNPKGWSPTHPPTHPPIYSSIHSSISYTIHSTHPPTHL